MKKIIFILCVLSLFSCDLFNTKDNGKDSPVNKNVRTFWAYDFEKEKDYTLQADLLVEGRYCNVWVERGSGVDTATARKAADAYDYAIYQKMIDAFSINNFTYQGYHFSNIMQFADAVGDGNGKLSILLLDIKDGYHRGVNDAYIAGYFSPVDLLRGDYSNLCDMIYIDVYPGKPGEKDSNQTLAHEMQHMMNLLTSIINRLDPTSLPDGRSFVNTMDLWINEGLSSAAEWVYANEPSVDRLSWFNNNGAYIGSNKVMSGLIDKGNNFFVWGNREDAGEGKYANLDDYATVSLFFQWLRLQAGRASIYKDIIASSDYDHRAVTGAINAAVTEDYSSWEKLLKTWLAANYINASTGPYGYKNDPVLKEVKAPTAPQGTTSLSLYPGEGVYSITNSAPSISGQGTNIRNTYLSTSNSQVNDTAFSQGGALLTYNVNTRNYPEYNENGTIKTPIPAETGTTTGVAASKSAAGTASIGRSVLAPFTPYRIDAGDLLRRNGRAGSFSGVDLSGPLTEIVIHD